MAPVLSMVLVPDLGQTSIQLYTAQHHTTRVLQVTARTCAAQFCFLQQQKQGWFRSWVLKTCGTTKGTPQSTSGACPAPSARPRHAPAAAAPQQGKGTAHRCFHEGFHQVSLRPFSWDLPPRTATAVEGQSYLATNMFDGLLRQLKHS